MDEIKRLIRWMIEVGDDEYSYERITRVFDLPSYPELKVIMARVGFIFPNGKVIVPHTYRLIADVHGSEKAVSYIYSLLS